MTDTKLELTDCLLFGTNESMEALNNCLLKVIRAVNKAGLTPLATNVLYMLLGDIAKEMVNTPEKELFVNLGIKNEVGDGRKAEG